MDFVRRSLFLGATAVVVAALVPRRVGSSQKISSKSGGTAVGSMGGKLVQFAIAATSS